MTTLSGVETYEVNGASWAEIWDQIVYIVATQSAVLALSYPLRWWYRHFAKTRTGLGRLHLLKNKVLGDAYNPPVWPYAYFPIMLAVANFFLSAVTVYFWVVKTYRQTVDTWLLNIEYAISSFFMFHYLVNMVRNEFSLTYVVNIDSGIDLWTIVPVLMQGSVINTWLSWSYIRVYCLYRYFKRLMAIGYNPFEMTDVTEQMISSGLKFLTMTIILSGTMFIFEVLGPIKGFEDQYISTGMGDISFFSMFYFMLTTISTVGYGDLSPVTMLGRCLTFICVLNGVVFFSVESGRVLELQRREDSGEGRYKPRKKNARHVVICGGAVENSAVNILASFLEELTNPNVCGGEEFVPDVVLLGSRELSTTLTSLIRDHGTYKKYVYKLRGTAFEELDTERCCLKEAKMLYIIPNMNSSEPDKEDRYGILLASTILKVHVNIPMRLVLLRPENRRLASYFNIARTDCYALNEFKANMLAQSVRCPGTATLLLGLAHYPENVNDELLEVNPWIKEFRTGSSHQVYGALLQENYCELPFIEVCRQVYEQTGALLIACQISGRITTNPGATCTIGKSTVVFIVAETMLQIISVIQPGEKWKKVLATQRKAQKVHEFTSPLTSPMREHTPAPRRVDHSPGGELSGKKSPDSVTLIHPLLNLGNSLNPNQTAPQDTQDAAISGPKVNSLFGTDEVAPAKRSKRRSSLTRMCANSLMESLGGILALDSNKNPLDEQDTTNMEPAQGRVTYHRQVSRFKVDNDDDDDAFTDRGSMTERGSIMSSNSRKRSVTGTDIGSHFSTAMSVAVEGRTYPSVLQSDRGHVVVLAVGDLLAQQLVSFIKPLRQAYLVVWKEIVIVSRTELSDQILKFPGVHVIQREPMQYGSLEESCVQDASKVIILDGFPPTLQSHQMDERTILCNGVVESYLSQYPEKTVPKITVLHNRHNIKQLVGDAVAANNDEEGAKQEDRSDSQEDGMLKPHMGDTVNSAIAISKMGKTWLRKTRTSLTRIHSPPKSEEKGKKRRRRSTITGALMNQNKRVTRLSFPPDVHPHFVSGTSMALPDITRFAAHAYHTPGVLELIQNLIAPGIENMPAMLWSLALDGDYQNFGTWEELTIDCIKQGCIPLALFRGANGNSTKPLPKLRTRSKGNAPAPEKENETVCPFVVTNPPKDSIPTRDDRALVLAPKRWAYANCIAKEIVELFSAKRASYLILACFRGWRTHGHLDSDEDEDDDTTLVLQEVNPPTVSEILAGDLQGDALIAELSRASNAEIVQEARTQHVVEAAPHVMEVDALVNEASELTTEVYNIAQLAQDFTFQQRMELIQALSKMN